jgi:hypothetical protein
VADGTEVHFSVVVSGMSIGRRVLDHWDGLGSDSASVKPVYRTVLDDLAFEDINNNKAFDLGLDLDLDDNPRASARGEDVNGDGRFDWSPDTVNNYDTWYDFNGNGRCDPGSGENDTVIVEGKVLYADLNADGDRDRSEIIVDRGVQGDCKEPPSGDYPYGEWETRSFFSPQKFRDNDFAVVIAVSAVTKNGVANTTLRYPRQYARRFFVTVNAEANGIRDRDGERYLLPQIK